MAARFPQRWPDAVVTVISLLGISIPIFVLGYTFQFFFAAQLQWLPASGRINRDSGGNSHKLHADRHAAIW